LEDENLHASEDKKIDKIFELREIPMDGPKLPFLVDIDDRLVRKPGIIGTMLRRMSHASAPKGVVWSGVLLQEPLLDPHTLPLEFGEEHLMKEL
jgi:hypothetical protein